MNIPLPFYAPLDALPGLELNTLIDYLFLFFLSSITTNINFNNIDTDPIIAAISATDVISVCHPNCSLMRSRLFISY